MRLAARHLGIGQAASAGGYTTTPSGATIPTTISSPVSSPSNPVNLQAWCSAQKGMTYDPSTNTCAPAPPVGYATTTPSGTIPGNTSGQTNPSLASTAEGLCEQQGGDWDTSTASCNYNVKCTQFPFGGTFNTETGECSYMNFYLTVGGIALFAFVLIAMAGRR